MWRIKSQCGWAWSVPLSDACSYPSVLLNKEREWIAVWGRRMEGTDYAGDREKKIQGRLEDFGRKVRESGGLRAGQDRLKERSLG